ncbi:hypothetical protein D3C83_101180 [compost metagenome]
MIGIRIAGQTFVTAKQTPGFQGDSDFLSQFPAQRLFRRLSRFHVAAKQIPMIGKRNRRLVVPQVNEQLAVPVEKQRLGDLDHRRKW